VVRLLALFGLITIIEIVAVYLIRTRPLLLPTWFATLLGAAKLLMCVGGVEAARWLLRHSPAAHRKVPESDWTRLWLWTGVPGGFMLGVGSLLGKLATLLLPGRIIDFFLLGHFVAGALVWTAAAPWAVADTLKSRAPATLERRLMELGLLFHGLGFALLAWVYPGLAYRKWPEALLWTLGQITHYYYIFYYVLLAALLWGAAFRYWRPAAEAAPPAPEE
jgi:hypothetical protein